MLSEKELDAMLDALDTSLRCKPNETRGLTALLIPMRSELDSARGTTLKLRQGIMTCLVRYEYDQMEKEIGDRFGYGIWRISGCLQPKCFY